jgi:hypothetical protein
LSDATVLQKWQAALASQHTAFMPEKNTALTLLNSKNWRQSWLKYGNSRKSLNVLQKSATY